MGKYTSDDNRSMQLNPNNERYYSSRGGDGGDPDYDGDASDEWFDEMARLREEMYRSLPTGDLIDYARKPARYRQHAKTALDRPSYGDYWAVDEFKQFKKGEKFKCPCCSTVVWRVERIEIWNAGGLEVWVKVRDTSSHYKETTIRFHESENYELGHAILHRRNRNEGLPPFNINSFQSIT